MVQVKKPKEIPPVETPTENVPIEHIPINIPINIFDQIKSYRSLKMTVFNETVPIRGIQGATGSVGTTKAKLVDVTDKVAHKGTWIKNTHATQKLFVFDSRVSATTGYELGVNEEIFLELERPDEIFVVGSAASTTYTWIAY